VTTDVMMSHSQGRVLVIAPVLHELKTTHPIR
jgi:hypothetical protein